MGMRLHLNWCDLFYFVRDDEKLWQSGKNREKKLKAKRSNYETRRCEQDFCRSDRRTD
nr:MAG TPA: hypothetical protein [Bacteriophage sp.]